MSATAIKRSRVLYVGVALKIVFIVDQSQKLVRVPYNIIAFRIDARINPRVSQ